MYFFQRKYFAYIHITQVTPVAGYATKDWANMISFHGSLFSKNTDRKVIETEIWEHGSVYCQNLRKYYFLG